ncbi:DNA primase [compost metagenome]
MKVTPDMTQEISQRNPIVEVLADYGVTPRYDGKALCPFHEEDGPSFMVYSDTNTYHCYGCGAGSKGKTLRHKDGTESVDAGSDVIGFIMNIENVSFPEACKILMRRSGMKIPDDKIDAAAERAKDAVMDRNRRFYNALMKNQDVLDYIAERGMDITDITKWRLGWVPQSEPGGNRGRLVFSIMEHHYKPELAKSIALAYRKLDPNDNGPKYRNDPHSNVYNKSQVLYGMAHAAPNIRKKRYAIAMEGYVDVILAHKVGLDNSVATCGTSFTDEQVALLRRYTDQLFLWYDGDDAGQNAAFRALPDLLKAGFTVMIVKSRGEDPAEVIQRVGKDAIVDYIMANSFNAVQLMIDEECTRIEAILNKERTKALNKLLPIVNAIQKPAEKYNYDGVIRKRLGLG